VIIFFFLFCFYIEKQKVVEIRQRKEWPTAKLLGLFRFIETMDRGDPLKEATRCRRNALLLNQVKKPSRLLLKEGISLGEELGGLTPNLRV